jgi:hypothetical protein
MGWASFLVNTASSVTQSLSAFVEAALEAYLQQLDRQPGDKP